MPVSISEERASRAPHESERAERQRFDERAPRDAAPAADPAARIERLRTTPPNLSHVPESAPRLEPRAGSPRERLNLARAETPAAPQGLAITAPENRLAFLNAAADAIESHREVFTKLLETVNTPFGANYEITQAVKTLRGVEQHELGYLNRAGVVGPVAVYASRNIPLYTLVMHGLIPATASHEVFLRTPKQTEALYQAIFAKLRELLPQYDMSSLQVMPPVYYDQFYKENVLGLNRKGKHLREGGASASTVIFVGSPETGAGIREQVVNKLGQIGNSLPPVRQAFMMFGTGLNPVVITNFAKGQLDAAARDAALSVKINNAQDCIAAKFYAVHQTMMPDFLSKLKGELGKLHYGPLGDPRSDYTPLTFTDKVDSLAAFRAKYADYLVTKDAVLDPATKHVDPHVFVFPYSKFKSGEVELQDHYAPFFVLFSYDNDEELKEIANDPRVRDRAMFASLYGDPAATEMWKLRKTFEDNFHTTTTNLSVFDEESGNFAFGGYGGKASSLTLIEKGEGTQVTQTTMDRPLLFSKTIAEFFGKSESALPPASVVAGPQHPKSQERLAHLLQQANDPRAGKGLPQNYDKLVSPQFAPRPHGLPALRESIARGGLHIVHDQWWAPTSKAHRFEMRTPEGKKRMDEFFGADVVDFEALPHDKITKVPGVMLHASSVGADVRAMNRVRGEISPHMAYGYVSPLLEDRINEYHAVDAVWPGFMPPAESAGDLLAEGALSARWQAQRDVAREQINALIASGRDPSPEDLQAIRAAITPIIVGFMEAVQKRFPKGAFIKNYGESTTGDLGNQITSFHYNLDNIVDQYMTQFGDVTKAAADKSQHHARTVNGQIDNKGFAKKMAQNYYATGTKFVQQLLTHPEKLLAQERMTIAKSPLGFNKEIRVDYLDGTPISARSRYSHEYMREEEEEAKRVLAEFFARAPEQMKYMCGGADLVKLEDGSWKLVELNPGAYSGSISARTFPIEANRFIASLQGKPTPLIASLEALASATPAEQRKALRAMPVEEERWHKETLKDMSVAEVAKYLRDRALDKWMQDPTREGAERMLGDLRAAFADVNSVTVRDLALLLRGAEDFVRSKLTNR